MKHYELNIVTVTPTWNCCDYAYMVYVNDEMFDLDRHNYILAYLKRMFGVAEYFWKYNDHAAYLVGRKIRVKGVKA